MPEKQFVSQDQCKERCDNIKSASKTADKHLREWLQSLDGKFWAVIIITFAALLSSVGTLLVLLLKNGGWK